MLEAGRALAVVTAPFTQVLRVVALQALVTHFLTGGLRVLGATSELGLETQTYTVWSIGIYSYEYYTSTSYIIQHVITGKHLRHK